MGKLLSFIRLLKSPGDVTAALLATGGSRPRGYREHVRAAVEWLLHSQSIHDDGGYAHSYSLHGGWEKSYPETTGYIVPTMLAAAGYLGDSRCRASALRTGPWLLETQQPDGSFPDLIGRPQVFDTGQIIEGLLCLYGETGEGSYLACATRAGEFLVRVQDENGAWTRQSYGCVAHTYYTRVAANLLRLWRACGDSRFRDSAERMLEWTLGQQVANGYFRHMEFVQGELPYLHTIIYVLEGLLGSYEILDDPALLESVKRTTNSLVGLEGGGNNMLRSQYDEMWHAPSDEKCVTGLAQWAGLLCDLSRITGEESYAAIGKRVNGYLMARQVFQGSDAIWGALSGSIPLWGSYFRFAYNNWTVKFFIDGLLKAEGHFPSTKTTRSKRVSYVALAQDVPGANKLRV